MPEGDSAYRVAGRLRDALAGRVLTRFQIRHPDLVTADLTGRVVKDVVPAGKHVFIRIDDLSLHSHMRMDGVWHIYPAGGRWRRPAHQARLILATDGAEAVGYNLADIQLLPTEGEDLITRRLGPDPLKAQWDEGGLDEATLRVRADSRPLHVALLDQWNVAGFGNIYANEICFLAGLDPHTPANEVDVAKVLRLGARLIRVNKDRPRRVTTGTDRPGRRHHVYGRAGRPCFRCGGNIRFTRLGANPSEGRHVYWCPTCQPTA